jgi:hypothetical protein
MESTDSGAAPSGKEHVTRNPREEAVPGAAIRFGVFHVMHRDFAQRKGRHRHFSAGRLFIGDAKTDGSRARLQSAVILLSGKGVFRAESTIGLCSGCFRFLQTQNLPPTNLVLQHSREAEIVATAGQGVPQ